MGCFKPRDEYSVKDLGMSYDVEIRDYLKPVEKPAEEPPVSKENDDKKEER